MRRCNPWQALMGAALGLLLPLASRAEAPLEVGVFAGGTLLGSDTGLGNPYFADQQPRSSFTLGVRSAWRLQPRWAVEAELDYTPTATRGALSLGRPGVGATLLGPRVHVQLTVLPTGSLRPFVVGGAAASAYLANAPERYAIVSPDVDVGLQWGVGVEYDLGEGPYALRLDARQALFPGQDRTYLTHGVNLGLVFDVSGESRRQRQELLATERGTTGDGDGDGVADASDRCPAEREVPNGIDDGDGCPEVDSDGDGLLGARDACPDAAEDVDGDGDQDGCPEAPPARQRFTGGVEGIQFAFESADISPASVPVLERAVEVLREYPEARIEVTGFTDDRGGEDVNTRLSRERADAVRWYLVDRGIAPQRIVTLGLGAARPVGSNADEAGRARNRRIEFRICDERCAP